MMVREIDLRLRNDGMEIRQLASTLEYIGGLSNIPSKALFRLNLAIDELLTNTISYGYPDAREAEINVRLRHTGDRLEVRLADDGIPFDPLTLPDPDTTSDLDQRAVGGLGVHLVRTLMDGVTYERDHHQNIVTLTLLMPPSVNGGRPD